MLRQLALCLAFTLIPPMAVRAEGEALRWSATPNERGRIQLRLGLDRETNSREWAPQDLQGLDMRFADGPLSFRLVRDAGTLNCTGMGRRARGEGECRFVRDPGYFQGLGQRGIRVTDDWRAWQLAQFDVSLALLDELKRQNYATPSLGDLIAAGVFKLDMPFLRELDAAGFHQKALGNLVPLRIHGVTPDWIAGWRALGYDFMPGQLATTRIHDISPAYARGVMALVRDRPTLDQFVQMRLHGVRSNAQGAR